MAKTTTKTIYELVGEYSSAVGRYGPGSQQTTAIRVANSENAEFIELADALDRIKEELGGRGIDYDRPEICEEAGYIVGCH